MMNNNPIGIFDSGVGGLSVWKEIEQLLPNESIIYYADSANCPYGSKSNEEIIELSKKIVDFFISKNVKLIVLACNTATASAIDYLRANYDIPFVGMEPAVKPAASNSKNGVIGVLATEGTFNGRLFNETTEKWASGVKVEIQIGKGFVELVENGDLYSSNALEVIRQSLKPLMDKGIDQLVLACTHYPFLIEGIKSILNNSELEIINPAPAVAKQVQALLIKEGIETVGVATHEFYSSGQLKILRELVNRLPTKINGHFEQRSLA